MLCSRADADFELTLDLEPEAARSARELVGHIDHPAPQVRKEAMLLTSELVTRAVQRCDPVLGESVRLRVWMPEDLVRVELRAASAELFRPYGAGPHYDQLLLDRLADRWSIESGEGHGCAWFEIDQRPEKASDSAREQ